MVHSTDLMKATKSKVNNNTWLGNTGATSHMRYSSEGMKDLQETEVPITIRSGKKIVGTKIGTRFGPVLRTDGTTEAITLKDVLYCPELSFNLFSLTKAISNGGRLGSNGNVITVMKE